ncbi:MAG: hypothetical protein ACHQE5_00510 [Actinomycetes bacterium]
MRQALRGLTTRGRCFLGAGGASALCALLFGQRDLLRIAVLVAALPLVSAVVVSRTRYRIASSRRLEPARAPVGSDARVVLRLENVSRLPTGLLLLEDRIPYVLGRGRGSCWTASSRAAPATSRTRCARRPAAASRWARCRSG